MTSFQSICIAEGDGIGPEIMEATIAILRAADAPLHYVPIHVGESLYKMGEHSGIAPRTWEDLYQHRILLKAPITTPQGKGFRSLNVALRKGLGLYANVRPCLALSPFVATQFPQMDLVIVRENEEDLYVGIEYQYSEDAFCANKLTTQSGSARIIRYAFEYARQHGRRKLTCLSKDNILKMTDGCFHRLFDETARCYPDLEAEHFIIDIGTAKLAHNPERFDVIVTSNLYGDILSDVAAELMGSVGLAGSANIGSLYAMFEAVHGSAPDIAGKQIANPSGLLQAAVLMLRHLQENDLASCIHNAWLTTLEDGVHTADIYSQEHSTRRVSTMEFAEAVIERLGQCPKKLGKRSETSKKMPICLPSPPMPATRAWIGVDLFLVHPIADQKKFLETLPALPKNWTLESVSNRGIAVWPEPIPDPNLSDLWCCRCTNATMVDHDALCTLLLWIAQQGWILGKIECLYTFDNKPGFSAL